MKMTTVLWNVVPCRVNNVAVFNRNFLSNLEVRQRRRPSFSLWLG
jgi:hypothetical protein